MAAKTKGGGVRAEGMLSGMFGFAAPALAGGGRIELLGCREAVVDGCKSVLEYDDTVIRLNMGKTRVTFTGRNLSIRSFEKDHAEIEGIFSGIEFG